MAQPNRRTGRGRRALLVRLCFGLAVLAMPAMFPLTAASFTGSTADDGNSMSTAEVAAPSALDVVQTCAAGPGIELRAVTSADDDDHDALANVLTLLTPPGTAANDVLIAQVSNRGTFSSTLTPPSGWNLIRRDPGTGTSGSAVTAALYWRLATSSEPASAVFTLTSSSTMQMVGGIAAYSGVHSSSPVLTSGSATGLSATATAPSVTTTVADAMLVHTVTKRQEVPNPPLGPTSRWGLVSGPGTASAGAAAADEVLAAPGAAPARSWTSPTNFMAEWLTHTVALRPAPGAPSASATWTASPSSWATGYRLERSVGGTVQATHTTTPISATSTTDGPLVNGTTYSYRLWAYHGTWTSPAVTATLTPSC